MQYDHHFTLDEANKLLPWLEAKLTEIEPYLAEMRSKNEETARLLAKSRSNGGSSHVQDDLDKTQQLIEELQKSLQDILEQILAKGIVVRSLERGLVDFPSLHAEREVYLCWIRGEPDIAYWHEINTGFANRRPL